MNSWDTFIDPATFGVIAGYLRSPRSPIEHVLHVRDRAQLAPLANHLDRTWPVQVRPDSPLSPSLWAMVQDGRLKLSSRQPIAGLPPDAVVDAQRIQPSALTYVIYLPPFYLAHTPGLFEGKVFTPPRRHRGTEERSNPSADPAAEPAQASKPVKAHQRKHDQEQGH